MDRHYSKKIKRYICKSTKYKLNVFKLQTGQIKKNMQMDQHFGKCKTK